MNGKARAACNFNFVFENEGLLEVKANHVHCIVSLNVVMSQKHCKMKSLLIIPLIES